MQLYVNMNALLAVVVYMLAEGLCRENRHVKCVTKKYCTMCINKWAEKMWPRPRNAAAVSE